MIKFQSICKFIMLFIETFNPCYSGADLTALVREASMAAMKDYISKEAAGSAGVGLQIKVTKEHFDRALQQVKRSISEKVNLSC